MARYIDADKIEYSVDCEGCHGAELGHCGDCKEEPSIAYKNDVVLMPTEDMAPVVHSDWEHFKVNGQYKIRCKYCDYIEPEYRSYVRDFCPNCGAKMDKEEK